MSIKFKNILRVMSLLVLLSTFIPLNQNVLAAATLPPVDMFQLPWEQGLAWVALDGFDNGFNRSTGSPHNYLNGGAIDFAPHNNMIRGENTSKFWVTAAAAGTVFEMTKCSLKINHGNGWVTEYQHLVNFQVKVGDVVARNQKLAVIANATTQPVCAGSVEPDIPHLHFVLRPTMIGATFAGWEFRYSWFWNSTTFRKGNQTVGLYKPLLNVLDAQPTSTPVIQPTLTQTPNLTPSSTPAPVMSPTPTLFGTYISTEVNPPNINVGDSTLVTVKLNNVPADGFSSAEITCGYDTSLFSVSNIAGAPLFGADAVTAINGPQNGKFIVAMAGSHGAKATTSGTLFTFNITGSQIGQAYVGCEARVSKGDKVLIQIPSAYANLTVIGNTPTSTPAEFPTPSITPTFTQSPAPFTPTVLPSACDRAEFIADINIPPGTVMAPGTTFTKTWRLKNVGSCDWSRSYSLVFFYGEQMGAVSSVAFPVNVLVGQTADVSINMTAPNAPGSYRGYWMFMNSNGTFFGIGPDANQPWFVDINVFGPTLPPSPTAVMPSVTPTSFTDNWLTFTNYLYGFQFKYPQQGQILAGNTNNYARINLPIMPGTNLSEKYLEVIVAENANPCQSSLPTPNPPETVTINGITFLKQTGEDGAAGSLYQWVAYSTLRNNICVSLDFILHSHNPGVYQTPPPVFDFAAESVVFEQIVSTYIWLSQATTATPIITATPFESATPIATQTVTPFISPTATPISGAILLGQVIANKAVTIRLLDANQALITTVNASPDGTFNFQVASGTYTIIATANGSLSAQGTITLADGEVHAMPIITLLAGDIDGNNVIDQFDAMTIGMSYNTAFPDAADLNNDGIINVFDLEIVAGNYRKTGPTVWQ